MAAAPTPPVRAEIAAGVGTITLDRPERLNAFNLELAQGCLDALRAFAADDAVRVVVLRGAGRVFSAGGDVVEMLEHVRAGVDRAAFFREPLTKFNHLVMALRRHPKPVIAAVHGAVAGVAFNVMLATDLRLAHEDTRFSQAFIKLGLSPDGGGSWSLRRALGHARAAELTLLPTELDARQAVAWGLVNWAVSGEELEAKLAAVTAALVAAPAEALRRTKALLTRPDDLALSAHMETERYAQIDNAASADFEEGLSAFIAKRPPKFD